MEYRMVGIKATELDALMAELRQLIAERDALKAALELLYSWANNWDSEFMNDPDWKNRDVLIVQEALKGLKWGQ